MDDLQIFKEKFDLFLKARLKQKTKQLATYSKDPFVLDYIDYAKKITVIGGKRIRPYIAYLMYKSFGGKEEEKVLKLLTSLEILHSFLLMHDDIIDKGTLRHGIKTSHIYIANKLTKAQRHGEYLNLGKSQAMLLGDFLFSWSQEIINQNSDFNEKILKNLRRYFYAMVDKVILGEMIDVDLTTRKSVTNDLIDQEFRLKTASYSFIGPMQIGVALADKTTKKIEKLCIELGTNLGIAFQIQDDLLDIMSTDKNMSKATSSDILQHQHTYFTQYIFEHGSKNQINTLNSLFEQKKNKSDKSKIKKLFVESGAIKMGKQIIENCIDKARELVKEFTIQEDKKRELILLIETIRKRTY
ncbi:MAG: polyprenyl synthetase family protein [Candidatus Levybacteria bacterium]|nr:polyprenyl synthetase family protein [Candidatus Levybacteria bacterium]